MLKAIHMITEAKRLANLPDPVVVDLHSARPDYRGFQAPTCIVSLEADPSFEEVMALGAKLVKADVAHAPMGNMFLVSGEIPRVTSYELGIRWGKRFIKAESKWIDDTLMLDERFLMCNLKDRGIVAFTGCGHAGVVNTARHAITLANGAAPLYAVMGGFHLADAEPLVMEQTALDLQACGVKVLLPGHCTGWRFKQQAEKTMPGCLAPSTTGTRLTFV
jgi:7,8-dihydropterin-6-yl-methyl-4-(beta-D-ribofuranosyl)aminobenzene 5'-phosphate synthase